MEMKVFRGLVFVCALAALIVGAGLVAESQNQIDIFPGKVIVRSTAADALALRGGINVASTVSDGSDFMGSLFFSLAGVNVAAVRAREFLPDEYGLALQCFNINGLRDCLRISGDGEITSPTQPGFLVYPSANVTGTSGTVQFNSELYDDSNAFASNVFTANIAGRYLFSATVTFNPDSASPTDIGLQVTTTNGSFVVAGYTDPGGGGQVPLSGAIAVHMSAGHTATLTVTSTNGAGTVLGGTSPYHSFFSGRLLP
jgi:hypothetical protein